MRKYLSISLLVAALLLSGCASKRKVVGPGQTTVSGQQSTSGTSTLDAAEKLNIVRATADQAVYQRNIVAKIDFSVNTGKKNISLDGQLRMRRDEVIRLQIAPLGLVEVARIEFTPDYVLLMDRVHKNYVKGGYDEVGFLRANGLNFYSLQALFWNQLFKPGAQKIGEAEYGQYDVEKSSVCRILLHQDKMDYAWTVATGNNVGRIQQVSAVFHDPKNGDSTLEWNYDKFKSMGSKYFPYDHRATLTTNALKGKKTVTVGLEINKITDDANWETQTSVSNKYKKVSAEDILDQITGM